MKNLSEIKFFAYCRKSSESEDRQIASIDDQKRELRDYAGRQGINIVRIYEESQTAHKRGRPIFADMMSRIERGEAKGLLVWHVNRIARNAFDGGWIITAIDEGVLAEIRTPHKTYQNYSDDKFFLQLEFGMAKKDSDDKGVAVKRAFKGKLEKGWRPGSSPIGYINVGEEGNKTIVPDPDRFSLVRRMWDLFLSGTYSVSKIRDIATDEWGLRTRTRKKIGGQPLTMSHMYNIFRNPFYYGWFDYKNPETGDRQLYRGKHEPMITEQEYQRAQLLLGKHGKPRPHVREFAFTGTMRCGECDSMITAEEKNQIICTGCKQKFAYENKTACPKCKIDISRMKNPVVLNYVYYHCTKKKKRDCSQGSIRLEDLERQFNAKLDEITIDQDYMNIALEYLREHQQLEVGDAKAVNVSLQEAYDNCQRRIDNLQDAYISPQNSDLTLYTAEEFKATKARLLAERESIKQKLAGAEQQIDKSYELTEKVFNFCTCAKAHFNNGDLQAKRTIFSSIGSNLILKDKKLTVGLLEPYFLISRQLATEKTLSARLEPKKKQAVSSEMAVSETSKTALLRR